MNKYIEKNKKKEKTKGVIYYRRKLTKIELIKLNMIIGERGKISEIKKDNPKLKIRKGDKLGAYWKIREKKIEKNLKIKLYKIGKKSEIKKNKKKNYINVLNCTLELSSLKEENLEEEVEEVIIEKNEKK